MLECTLYNSVRNTFRSLYENVVLGSLKYVFLLNHATDINFYLKKATSLRCSRELAGLTPS